MNKDEYYVLAIGGHFCPYCGRTNDEFKICKTLKEAKKIKKKYNKKNYISCWIIEGKEIRDKITLTENEKVILNNLNDEYIHISRDVNGQIYIGIDYFGMYNHLFQFIKNGEEYNIKELLEKK